MTRGAENPTIWGRTHNALAARRLEKSVALLPQVIVSLIVLSSYLYLKA